MPALQSPALCLLPGFYQPRQWYAERMAGGARYPRGQGSAQGSLAYPGCPSPHLPTGTPHALIVRRYLSLLDTAVELELPGYRGPRLPRRQQVPIFPQPLITDRARCKYRWAGSLGQGEGEPEKHSRIARDHSQPVPPPVCLAVLEGRNGP